MNNDLAEIIDIHEHRRRRAQTATPTGDREWRLYLTNIVIADIRTLTIPQLEAMFDIIYPPRP